LSGLLAIGFHLAGKLEGFWRTAAPLNLAFCCLFLAFIAIPPPPAWGALASVALALACGAVVLRQSTRKIGLLLALALPFAGALPPLACWAPLATSVLFVVLWRMARREKTGAELSES